MNDETDDKKTAALTKTLKDGRVSSLQLCLSGYSQGRASTYPYHYLHDLRVERGWGKTSWARDPRMVANPQAPQTPRESKVTYVFES